MAETRPEQRARCGCTERPEKPCVQDHQSPWISLQYDHLNHNIFYCAKLEGEYNCIVYLVSSNPQELGEHFNNLMRVLGTSIKKIDLLFLDKIYKYVQFPEGEFS